MWLEPCSARLPAGPKPHLKDKDTQLKGQSLLAPRLASSVTAASTKASVANPEFSEIISNPQKGHVYTKTFLCVHPLFTQSLLQFSLCCIFVRWLLPWSIRTCKSILTDVQPGSSPNGAKLVVVVYFSCILKIMPMLKWSAHFQVHLQIRGKLKSFIITTSGGFCQCLP